MALAAMLPSAPDDAATPGSNVMLPACTAANAGSAPAGAKLRPVVLRLAFRPRLGSTDRPSMRP
eukprot:4626130-Alexandrium_andersonii.AAC.1